MPSSAGLVKLARDGAAAARRWETPSPRAGSGSAGRPHNSLLMKLASRPRNSPIGADRGGDVAEREDRRCRCGGQTASPRRRSRGSRRGTTCRPSTIRKISAGCWTKKARIVEQHIAGAAADDDADGDPEDEVVELRQRDRRRPAHRSFVLDQRAGVDPAQHDAADIGQRIPADRDRPDLDWRSGRTPERRSVRKGIKDEG